MKHSPKPARATTPQSAASVASDGHDFTAAVRERFAAAGLSPTGLLDFLLAITDNLGEGTCALDTQGRVTFMNPAAERLLGWPEAEARGHDLHAAVHVTLADGAPCAAERCPLLRAVGSGRAERVEDDTFTRRDGARFPVAYVASPIISGGVATGVALAFHDATEHRALDEALRRSERDAELRASQMMAVFESMADAVLVFDRDGRITQTNTADAEMLELTGRPDTTPRTLAARRQLFTLHDGDGRPIAPDQAPSARVLRGETLRGDRAEDVMFHTLDGHEIIVSVSGAPIRDSAGAVAGGVLIRRDVTRRRWLERRTREALGALMAMADALVSGAAGPDRGPLGSSATARRMAELIRTVMGCQRVNIVVYHPVTGLMRAVGVAGLSAEQERLWLASWPREGRSSDYLPRDLIARLHAGETIFVDRTKPPFDRWPNPFGSRTVLVLPMRIGDEHLGDLSLDYGPMLYQPSAEELAMAGAVTRLAAQIVERERLARDRETARANALALAETTRRMDEFLSIAAHELKTPVTNSVLALTLAADTTRAARERAGMSAQDVQTLAMLERAETHIERLSRLVVDLLDVSRIRAGKLELRVAQCDLAALAREAVEEQRQMAPGRAIRLRLPPATRGPLIVAADSDRIRQVISNYLTNALKYSRESQPVSVSVRADGEWARVAVRDEGPGVPIAEQAHVWERFYRVQGTQVVSGVGVGLGLGLHISRTIIEQHEGTVGLRNAPGRGAIFWFALRQVEHG